MNPDIAYIYRHPRTETVDAAIAFHSSLEGHLLSFWLSTLVCGYGET